MIDGECAMLQGQVWWLMQHIQDQLEWFSTEHILCFRSQGTYIGHCRARIWHPLWIGFRRLVGIWSIDVSAALFIIQCDCIIITFSIHDFHDIDGSIVVSHWTWLTSAVVY